MYTCSDGPGFRPSWAVLLGSAVLPGAWERTYLVYARVGSHRDVGGVFPRLAPATLKQLAQRSTEERQTDRQIDVVKILSGRAVVNQRMGTMGYTRGIRETADGTAQAWATEPKPRSCSRKR